jgi:hypothetical protein
MKFRHKFDKSGEQSEAGYRAETLFMNILKKIGDSPKKSEVEEDKKGIDIHSLTIGSVDVKAMKKKIRRESEPQEEWVWVEFLNVIGQAGWLYKGAEYVAFEGINNFVVVKKKELAELCESIVDMNTKVYSPTDAFYKAYSRPSRRDLIAMIKREDLLTLNYVILEK